MHGRLMILVPGADMQYSHYHGPHNPILPCPQYRWTGWSHLASTLFYLSATSSNLVLGVPPTRIGWVESLDNPSISHLVNLTFLRDKLRTTRIDTPTCTDQVHLCSPLPSWHLIMLTAYPAHRPVQFSLVSSPKFP